MSKLISEVVKINDKDIIMVTHDKKNKKFLFYNKINTFIGDFTIDQLIKYIGHFTYNDFMKNISFDDSIDIIETFIGKNINNTQNNSNLFNIKLNDHINSPFMGNIEMLIRLNNDITNFKINNLNDYLKKIPNDKLQFQVEQNIKQFIFILQNHILKIISLISKHLKNDNSKSSLKKSLLYYSTNLMHSITTYVMNQIEIQTDDLNDLQENLYDIASVKLEINNKITNLSNNVEKQNNYINKLISKLNNTYNGNIDNNNNNNNDLIVNNMNDENSNNNSNNNINTNENDDDSNLYYTTSSSSDIIEEIINQSSSKNISTMEFTVSGGQKISLDNFDSENKFNSEKENDTNHIALNYLSDEQNNLSINHINKNNNQKQEQKQEQEQNGGNITNVVSNNQYNNVEHIEHKISRSEGHNISKSKHIKEKFIKSEEYNPSKINGNDIVELNENIIELNKNIAKLTEE